MVSCYSTPVVEFSGKFNKELNLTRLFTRGCHGGKAIDDRLTVLRNQGPELQCLLKVKEDLS